MDSSILTHFATTETANGGIMGALGIDWKLLVMQLVAFLLLVWALNKWVFPIFFKIVDKRQALIDESNRAAVEASKHAETAQAETEKLLKQARSEAKDIVATAREEAAGVVSDAEEKSKQQAEYIVNDARDQLAIHQGGSRQIYGVPLGGLCDASLRPGAQGRQIGRPVDLDRL